jgi:hypothetical protein
VVGVFDRIRLFGVTSEFDLNSEIDIRTVGRGGRRVAGGFLPVGRVA